jgi:hypothetical protein
LLNLVNRPPRTLEREAKRVDLPQEPFLSCARLFVHPPEVVDVALARGGQDRVGGTARLLRVSAKMSLKRSEASLAFLA